MVISVPVSAMALPARRKNGTPPHRGESKSTRNAPKVSVSESGRHAGHRAVAVVLAADEVLRVDRPGRHQHLGLLVAHLLLVAKGLGALVDRLLHGEQRHHLQQVVLHDVAQRADRVVERAAVLDAERLGHRDLHRRHVGAAPQRLEDGVGEAGDQQAAHRLLAEEVVDAEDGRLGEVLLDRGVELDRRRQVAAERLLDDEAGALVEPDLGQAAGHALEHRRRDGHVEDRVLDRPHRLLELHERLGSS